MARLTESEIIEHVALLPAFPGVVNDILATLEDDNATLGALIQLVGRDPGHIAEGARLAAQAGAQIIDLNFGCPAKEVTGVLSGSALMREPDLAESLIAAAVDAVDVPVTVKMRLGWDAASKNAPDIAARAQARGAP